MNPEPTKPLTAEEVVKKLSQMVRDTHAGYMSEPYPLFSEEECFRTVRQYAEQECADCKDRIADLESELAKPKAEREWLSGRLTNAGTMQVNDETLTGVFIEVSKEKLSGVSALPMYETILMQPIPSAPEAKEGV